jgi:SAM-dependent methyltransferase
MRHDYWLSRWLSLIIERSWTSPVLELGCGSGEDTETLFSNGLKVIALDRSEQAIAAARSRVPAATFLCRDVRNPFPIVAGSAGTVVASLSLHYFPWIETVALVHRVREALHPGGVLLCRLNSTKDVNFGAIGHPAIEENYYSVNGKPKRFFDRNSIELLFSAGWRNHCVEEMVTNKYEKPKTVWEVILEKGA